MSCKMQAPFAKEENVVNSICGKNGNGLTAGMSGKKKVGSALAPVGEPTKKTSDNGMIQLGIMAKRPI